MTKKIDKVKELEEKVNELDNQLKRAVADYQNLEKRVSEGRSELSSWANSKLLAELLPTLDHLDQALGGATDTDKQSGWFRGVELAVKELNQVLQSEGLEQITIEGLFDPNLHEAVDTEEGEDNTILKVVRRGYMLGKKVLRPAAVVVGKKNPPTTEETENIPGGETQSDVHSPVDEEVAS